MPNAMHVLQKAKHVRRCFEMTSPQPFLIPPRRFEAHGGFLSLPEGAVLEVRASSPQVMAVRLMEAALPKGTVRRYAYQERGFSLTLSAAGMQCVAPEVMPEARAEGYALAIQPEGITARAETEEGFFRLCAFLGRALQSGAVPCGIVSDAPVKKVRGLMLDVSRNRIYSVKTLLEVIDKMAQVGLNRLELYFENVFAYRRHPLAWAQTSPYTAADIATIEAYARARFVRFIPNQNTLGHFERWLKLPEYRCYAELPQGGARTPWGSIQQHPTGLFSADRATRDFVRGLLEELLPCFPHASSVNLGGDEVFDLGQGRSSPADKATLYFDYMREMADVALRYGKRPELWADMLIRHPELLSEAKRHLPEARWLVWAYEASDPLEANVARLQREGLETIACPGSSSWRSFCGRTHNMLANVHAAARSQSDGMLLTDWGDAGHWQPLTVSFPAIAAAAALGWSPESNPDVAAITDFLLGERGLGAWLLRLGDTYRTAKAEAGNATKLFQAYNLPLAASPVFETEALQETLQLLDDLAAEPVISGSRLALREARFALEMQRLAVLRAQRTPHLHRIRARLAAQLEQLWLERGPRAQLDDSLSAFLSQELPE